MIAKWRKGRLCYLHPASPRRRAYILPMSPIPMMPTTKSSIPGGGSRLGLCPWGIMSLVERRRSDGEAVGDGQNNLNKSQQWAIRAACPWTCQTAFSGPRSQEQAGSIGSGGTRLVQEGKNKMGHESFGVFAGPIAVIVAIRNTWWQNLDSQVSDCRI